MTVTDQSLPSLTGQDEFSDLVEALRKDFRRVFPHLRPKENECFFVQQNDDQTSGKVWIEMIRLRDERQFRSRITVVIEGNRVIRRVQEETEMEEQLENTALLGP
jgi:hypothetical protein